jgi:magnesium transporter
MMTYLSELLGRPVVDANGERLGQVEDLVVSFGAGVPQPRVAALKAQLGLVPFSAVAELDASPLRLRWARQEITLYEPAPADFHLARTLLDKHVIDTTRARAVRVNDIELQATDAGVCVSTLDVGGAGLLRRLGLSRIAQRLASRLKADFLDWEQVELLSGEQPLPAQAASPNASGDRLADLHPADRAEILSNLALPESSQIIEKLDAETVADTLEAVEPDLQLRLLETMPDERVAKIVQEMAPDEAADLLAEMPEERQASLLGQLEPARAGEVRRLLAYPPGTAGSLMTTEYVALPQGLTAAQTIARLREKAREAETLYYVYVIDDERRLAGVLALSDLVLAQPEAPMGDFMRRRVICVNARDSQTDVAQTVSKYHLLAVPVVDDEQRLIGMITAGDALGQLIPSRWKKRRSQRHA